MLKQLDRWHATKLGHMVFGLVELVLAYWFASLSVDRGNLWWYLLTLVFLVGTLRNLFALIGSFLHGKQQRGKAKRA